MYIMDKAVACIYQNRITSKRKLIALLFVLLKISIAEANQAISMDILRINNINPRYFSDEAGKIIYLTGSHTWMNFQDIDYSDPPKRFDYKEYLKFLKENQHNFIRLWVWEQAKWISADSEDITIEPLPFKRTGPGMGNDKKLKFDLYQFDDSYFIRLRERVSEALVEGIYTSIMLFNGFSIEKKGDGYNLRNPWEGHPFHIDNNINGIDGDPYKENRGRTVHSLKDSKILKIQESYVKKVVDTLNDFPNVLWEIGNESNVDSQEWQYHMIHFIRRYEKEKQFQHPIGMTAIYPNGNNKILFDSPADWISPGEDEANLYKDNPPETIGRKVILSDTDHLWGIGGSRAWVWKSFMRGLNPIFMDPYKYDKFDNNIKKQLLSFSDLETIRKNMGFTLNFAKRINLAAMTPQSQMSSSGYCLSAEDGAFPEILIYLPSGKNVWVDLIKKSGVFDVKWFDPANGEELDGGVIAGGQKHILKTPFSYDSVVYIHKTENADFKTFRPENFYN
jgi:hypothetical protein